MWFSSYLQESEVKSGIKRYLKKPSEIEAKRGQKAEI